MSTSAQLWTFSWFMSACVYVVLDFQRKTQKRKFQDGNFDEDVESEPRLKYKGISEDSQIAVVIIVR